MSENNRLEELLAKYFPKLKIKKEKLKSLELFVEELEKWNKSINLTSIETKEGIYVRHICDSLSLLTLKQVSLEGNLADIGSGAGFPSIPLSIVNDKLLIDSIEKTLKKITFQRVIKQKFDLNKLNPVLSKIEDHPDKNFYTTMFVRAFTSTEKILEIAQKILIPKGHCVLWKGPKFDSEWEEVEEDLKKFFILKHIQEFEYEEDDFASKLVIIQKKA